MRRIFLYASSVDARNIDSCGAELARSHHNARISDINDSGKYMIKELDQHKDIIKIVASAPIRSKCVYRKIVLRPIVLKNKQCFQAEMLENAKIFHRNIPSDELPEWVCANVEGRYKQILISMRDRNITYLTSSKGRVIRLEKAVAAKNRIVLSNNRQKNYILNEGDDVPAMIDLGIFTKERKVVAGMYDKFRQINRFVEILDDVFKNYSGSLTLLDFGRGKSYLTFITYHYLTNIRHLNAKIIGYDLKADVVTHCNELAAKYGYDNLRFEAADVSRDKLYDEHIDAVLSLHACDTATDYALKFAIGHDVRYIFSVPCCQHEVNASIANGGGDLDVLLKYGIVKERVSALLTDTIRAMLLEDAGYNVDVMEFVDLAHSPKNIMLRCVKTGRPSSKNSEKIRALAEKYHFNQTLYDLLNK